MLNPPLKNSEYHPEKHWEDMIILLTLLSVAAIHYFIYAKIAFLDFFYLLIVLAGYYVGKRLAILGAFFANIMVWVFILADRTSWPSGTLADNLDLTVWGGFLILAAWLIGSLSEKRSRELEESLHIRDDLAQSCQRLMERNHQLENQLKPQPQADARGS